MHEAEETCSLICARRAERRVGGAGSPESERSEEINRRDFRGRSRCWPCPSRLSPAPTSAASALSRLRVEKIEGGLMVAGVVVAANCRIALPAFGCLFLLAGAVLTAAAYRGQGIGEDSDHYAARVAFTGNSRVLGPACLVVGFLMAAIGIGLCFLTRRARESQRERRARRVGFHCPVHGDFWAAAPAGVSPTPTSPSASMSANGGALMPDKPKKRRLLLSLCPRGAGDEEDEEERGLGPNLVPPPLCPHSALSSTRSSLSSSWQPEAAASPGAASRCPTPVPFVTSCSVSDHSQSSPLAKQFPPSGPHIEKGWPCQISSGMVTSIGPGGISPDHTAFGSIRSLSISREVASFPLSRTPSPPPNVDSLADPAMQPNLLTSEDCSGQSGPNFLPPVTVPCVRSVYGDKEICLTVIPPPTNEHGCTVSTAPRKSVSIILPEDEERILGQPKKNEDDKTREEKG
ncbi:hypothetical protein J437_LFUL012795 [Ladona fulva]|uniref:Uncharacterized protein n=1 Tax=Ladona fulva TaxID=123851 RepID=A0A8K0PAG2_LADFU|nr:hypothetical protein J437_LFUL012795 [Ladona fulva]